MAENEASAMAEEAVEETEAKTEETVAAADANAEDTAQTTEASAEQTERIEDISYHAVEKEGSVTAIWEMQGEKHIRTIDPRSQEGKQILALFETAA